MKGYTETRFHGGPMGGNVYPKTRTLGLFDQLEFRDEFYFALDERGGGVALKRGELGTDWTACRLHLYGKRKRAAGSRGVDYDYAGERMVDRCSAATKKGSRCMFTAQEGGGICAIHVAVEGRHQHVSAEEDCCPPGASP